MRRTRTLALKRELLSALTTDELSSVAGGSHFRVCTVGHGLSFDVPCPTLPLAECATVGRPCFQALDG